MPSPADRRRLIRGFGLGLSLLSVVALGGSFFVESSYVGRAVKVQRVEVDKTAADLFGEGEAFKAIGSPQLMIIEDPKAFLKDAPDGTKQVDDAYLHKNKIYPLQLQTVKFTLSLVRLGFGIALAFGLLMAILARPKPVSNVEA